MEQSGQAEEEHVETQPDMGLEALEEDVGGDLEEDVGHEEDDERGVVFRLFKTELLGEAKYIGIGNVYTVCIARLVSFLFATTHWDEAYRERRADT